MSVQRKGKQKDIQLILQKHNEFWSFPQKQGSHKECNQKRWVQRQDIFSWKQHSPPSQLYSKENRMTNIETLQGDNIIKTVTNHDKAIPTMHKS